MDKSRATQIYKILENNYPGSHTALKFRNPLQMVIATILSAQCTDVRVNIVTVSLFKKYKTVDDFANAKQQELEQDIRSTGFYRSKARSIIETANIIKQKYNGKVPGKMEDLLTLRGVARKTANIVLWNSFGIISGIAVDTHVTRLSYRLGLSKNKDQNKIEQDLMNLYEKEKWPHFTNYIISHGRNICQAKKPMCKMCPLFSLCEKNGVDPKFYT